MTDTPKPLTADEIAAIKRNRDWKHHVHVQRLIAAVEQQAEQIEKLQTEKREIENAAYERIAGRLDKRAQNYRDTAARTTSDPETIPLLEAAAVASENEAEQIRSLIQPPAQKENGE